MKSKNNVFWKQDNKRPICKMLSTTSLQQKSCHTPTVIEWTRWYSTGLQCTKQCWLYDETAQRHPECWKFNTEENRPWTGWDGIEGLSSSQSCKSKLNLLCYGLGSRTLKRWLCHESRILIGLIHYKKGAKRTVLHPCFRMTDTPHNL